MAQQLSREQTVLLLIVGVVGVALVAVYETGGFSFTETPAPVPVKAEVVTPAAVRTDDDTGDGEEVILETIDTPSTARFVSSKLIATDGAWRMVHVVVDAQNQFGAMLRKSFCVTYFREGKRIRWSPNFGVQECGKPPSGDEITLLKSLNNWGVSVEKK